MPAPKDPIKRKEWLKNLSAALTGKKHIMKYKKYPKKSAAKKGCKVWNVGLTKATDPRIAKQGVAISAALTGKKYVMTQEHYLKKSAARKKNWQDLKYAAKIVVALTGKKQPKISAALKGKSRPDVAGENSPQKRPGTRRKHSVTTKKLWQEPVYIAKQIKANHTFPNKPEKFLIKLFNRIFPDKILYIGSGDFMLGRCNPDFVVTGQKKVIEFNGDFTHGPKRTGRTNAEEEQRQINHHANYGYQTLVIWERELENIDTLCSRIVEFVKA